MKRTIMVTTVLGIGLYFALTHQKVSPLSDEPLGKVFTQSERDCYEQIFYYTLDNVQPGSSCTWKTYAGKGTIHVSEYFISKSKGYCRKFNETFKVAGVAGGIDGVACKRDGDAGWCRLKETNALTCALEDRYILPTIPFPTFDFDMPAGSTTANGSSRPTSQPHVGAPSTPEAPSRGKSTGKDVANSVTKTAGEAGGAAAYGARDWYFKIFGN